jgi:hypothetical protein
VLPVDAGAHGVGGLPVPECPSEDILNGWNRL